MFFIVKPFENKFCRFTQYVYHLKTSVVQKYSVKPTYQYCAQANPIAKVKRLLLTKKERNRRIERSYCLEEFDFDCEIEIASVTCDVTYDT